MGVKPYLAGAPIMGSGRPAPPPQNPGQRRERPPLPALHLQSPRPPATATWGWGFLRGAVGVPTWTGTGTSSLPCRRAPGESAPGTDTPASSHAHTGALRGQRSDCGARLPAPGPQGAARLLRAGWAPPGEKQGRRAPGAVMPRPWAELPLWDGRAGPGARAGSRGTGVKPLPVWLPLHAALRIPGLPLPLAPTSVSVSAGRAGRMGGVHLRATVGFLAIGVS